MKAKVTYKSELKIPKDLPHGEDKRPEDGDPIFSDRVYVTNGHLVLKSYCGLTDFPTYEDHGDHYLVPAGTTATYEGAYAALESIWGIDFPNSTLESIESSYGEFETEWAYRMARRALQMVKSAEREGKLPELQKILRKHSYNNGNFKPFRML